MSHDRFTRACLAVIAVSLMVIAERPIVPVAHASSDLECTLEGPMTIRSIDSTIKVQVDAAFSSPGSSSSSPLYVEVKQ